MIRKPIATLALVAQLLVLLFGTATVTRAQSADDNPLAPVDISSPAATLQTFMSEMEAAIVAYNRGDLEGMRRHSDRVFQTLAIELPPTQSGFLQGSRTALHLFEVLIRLDLPPKEEIPGGDAVDTGVETDESAALLPASWRVPQTDIRIEQQRDAEGNRIGYRFSTETISRIEEFYRRAQTLPVQPEYRLYDGIVKRFEVRPGLSAPAFVVSVVNALPPGAFAPVFGQPLWKWATLGLGLGFATLIFVGGYRLAIWIEGGAETQPKRVGWARPLMLVSLILAVIFLEYVVIDVIRLTGTQLAVTSGLLTVIGNLTFIWLAFQLVLRGAHALISMRRMTMQSLDAQLLLLIAKVIAVLISVYVLIHLADLLSIPIAPMLAGLGVGGLAVALAVRPTLENAVAGFVLFADKPVKVGEFCAFGDKLGTVEQVGLRSVQVRGLDRTVITIPNAQFCDMEITNFSRRDSNLFHTTLGLRYETSADQLRLVLVRLRELMLRHPMVSMDPARVRFAGFGDFALNVEIFAFVNTRDWNEFLAVQEDLNLRIKDIVEGCGSGFAFPSQTLYMERGQGLVPEEVEKAEAMVARWREENRLPFPEHEQGFRFELASTLDWPPKGSPGNRNERPLPDAAE